MKKLSLLLALLITGITLGQKTDSPYQWDWKKDGPYLGVALAGTTGGFLLIQGKDGFTEAEILQLQTQIDDINFVDRWVAGNDNERASEISDIPFYISFAAPFALLLDDETNDHTGTVLGMYVESMATTGALFTIAAGATNRARPYVYSTDFPLSEQRRPSATRSFFSGHVAAAATATFFTAKVYSDFNPDSPAIPYIWAGAAIIPAGVGYLRMEAGQHFLTDVVLGYTIGAAVGYFVPELHKKDRTTINIAPTGGYTFNGDQYTGLSLQMEF